MASPEVLTEAEEEAREVLRQACVDGGIMAKGDELPDSIPLNVALAAIILEGMMH